MEILILLILGLLYFLPSFIGGSKSNSGAIFALNLLLGWTLIGWVVALVWALTKDAPKPPQPAFISTLAARSTMGEIDRYRQLKELRDMGVLSQEEFMEQVSKLP